jgi:DNA-binding beta-propeller fold protein YncE
MIQPITLDTTQIASDSGSQNMVVDGYNRLWVMASVNGVSSLSCFGENLKLEKKISFPKNYSLIRLAISPEKDQLYFIGQNQVQSLSIESTVYSDRITVFDKAKNCYGIGVDPRNGWLYVADAQDYVSNGTVYVVNRNGKIINTLTTGVIPTDFIFF